jgi:hypothetical protein
VLTRKTVDWLLVIRPGCLVQDNAKDKMSGSGRPDVPLDGVAAMNGRA